MRVLFICKKNSCYGFQSYTRRSSGLFNSTSFIVQALRALGIDAHLVEVNDNNDIDREVTKHQSDVVIIEALWVVPEKFHVLKKLHPKVKWFVHLHSHIPFLALEGVAMNWLIHYAHSGIGVIANSKESYKALRCVIPHGDITYLPNIYISRFHKKRKHTPKEGLDVGCFGAVRPMKNHLLQALASIRFAQDKCVPLRFHINATRTETNGDPVLKNLRELFKYKIGASLVEHPWMEPHDFLKLLNSTMDIGLQVSMSETWNVVSADYVTAGIPVVASKEVYWLSRFSKARDNSIEDIMDKMDSALRHPCLISWNKRLLAAHSNRAQTEWFKFCYSLSGE